MGSLSAGRSYPKHGSQTSIARSTCNNPKYGTCIFLEQALSYPWCCSSFILPFPGTIPAGVPFTCDALLMHSSSSSEDMRKHTALHVLQFANISQQACSRGFWRFMGASCFLRRHLNCDHLRCTVPASQAVMPAGSSHETMGWDLPFCFPVWCSHTGAIPAEQGGCPSRHPESSPHANSAATPA